MSRFWAQESSSDEDQSSDSDSHEEEAPIVRQADRKFGSTFDESDSGKIYLHFLFLLFHYYILNLNL